MAEVVDKFDQPVRDRLSECMADCVRQGLDPETIEQNLSGFFEENGLSLEAVKDLAVKYGESTGLIAGPMPPQQIAGTGFFCGFELAVRYLASLREQED